MNENPKLKKNILQEVVLEIRYNSKKDYFILFSEIYEKLKQNYSIFEKTDVPDFPKQPLNFPKFIKFRIKTSDEKKLFQIGDGILAINNLDYQGFKLFLSDILEILEIHKKNSDITSLDFILLRYINKITVDRSFEKIFKLGLKLPKTIENKKVGFNYIVNLKYLENFTKINLYSQPTNEELIWLDLSFYNDTQKISYNIKEVNNWIEEAHKNIYIAFKDCITSEYYNYLYKGE
ncbi:MAG: TIGR04255 family protein [Candidatus Humimicrobiaceae bacterium]